MHQLGLQGNRGHLLLGFGGCSGGQSLDSRVLFQAPCSSQRGGGPILRVEAGLLGSFPSPRRGQQARLEGPGRLGSSPALAPGVRVGGPYCLSGQAGPGTRAQHRVWGLLSAGRCHKQKNEQSPLFSPRPRLSPNRSGSSPALTQLPRAQQVLGLKGRHRCLWPAFPPPSFSLGPFS